MTEHEEYDYFEAQQEEPKDEAPQPLSEDQLIDEVNRLQQRFNPPDQAKVEWGSGVPRAEDGGRHRISDEIETTPVVPRHDPSDQVVELPPIPTPSVQPQMPGVQEVLMPQAMDLQEQDPTAKGPWIQYNGVATVRIITPSDWVAAGVQSRKYCEWNYLNGKRLPRSMFNDEELQYLLRVDGRFSLEKE